MKRLIISIILLAVLIGGAWFIFGGSGGLASLSGGISPRLIGSGAAVESDYIVPPLDDNYRNNEFKFSLTMPEGFTASEISGNEEDSGKSIIMQDAKGNGIQVYVTPDQGDTKVITADDVRASIPDMQVSGEQVVEIGNDYKGVAFMSDNEAFGGESREVWFVFRGNLYQISTYARLDPLLQAMFATWKFF